MKISGRNLRRNMRPKMGVNFSAVFAIIIISILAGYLTTKFVVYPLVGEGDTSMFTKLYGLLGKNELKTEEAEPPDRQEEQDGNQIVEDGLTVQDSNTEAEAGENTLESGYAVQFGSFSSKASAEKMISDLKLNGIDAKILEKDDTYKVIGNVFATKEEAVSAMELVDRDVYSDIFISES